MRTHRLFAGLLSGALALGSSAARAESPASQPTATAPGGGFITGTVEVPPYAHGRGYVIAAQQFAALANGEYEAYSDIAGDGSFRIGPLAPGEYYVVSFLDDNGDGAPDRAAEPFVLWPEKLHVESGGTIDGIGLRRFCNLPNPLVRTAQRQEVVDGMQREAEAALADLLAHAPPASAQPARVLPTLRIRIYEALRIWGEAEDEQAWELAADMLSSVPAWANAARAGADPFASERGWQLYGIVRANDGSVQPYLLYIPRDYDPQTPAPLVVSLHGGGGNHWSGAALTVGGEGLERYGPNRSGNIWPGEPTVPMFILAPFGDGGALNWRPPADLSVVQELYAVQAAYNIDPDRVYLTGYSNGGTGAWELGAMYPDKWAAIFLGGAAPAQNVLPFVMNLSHMPMRVYHGTHDQIIPVVYDRQVAGALARFDPQLEYIELDGYHDIAGEIYANGAALTWLSQFRRPRAPQKAHFRSASAQTLEGAGLVITQPAGDNVLMDVQVDWADAQTVHVTSQNIFGVTIRVPDGTGDGIEVVWNNTPLHVDGRPAAIALSVVAGAEGKLTPTAAGSAVPPVRPLGRWTRAG